MAEKSCSAETCHVCLCTKYKLTENQSKKFHQLRDLISEKVKEDKKKHGWVIIPLEKKISEGVRNALDEYFFDNGYEVFFNYYEVWKIWLYPRK